MNGVFVYGGCVTRDAVPYLGTDYRITKYVARQSLISAAHRAVALPVADTALKSKFQMEQLRGDLASSLFPSIVEFGRRSDVLILDLIVERLGVRYLGQGYATCSNEFANSGLERELPSGSVKITFGTDRHFALWSKAARSLRDNLLRVGVLERTLLFDTPWALFTASGDAIPGFRGKSSREMNEAYERYYSFAAGLGIRVERIPDEFVVGDDSHKWGRAPYHYVPAAYEWMASVVHDTVSGDPGQATQQSIE